MVLGTQLPQSKTGEDIDEIIDEDVGYTKSPLIDEKQIVPESECTTDVYADNGKPKTDRSEYLSDFNQDPNIDIETEPVYLNNLGKKGWNGENKNKTFVRFDRGLNFI